MCLWIDPGQPVKTFERLREHSSDPLIPKLGLSGIDLRSLFQDHSWFTESGWARTP
jgi:hypothetical protein